MNLLLWMGPVSASNLRTVRLPDGWTLRTVNRGAGGLTTSSAFRELCAAGLDSVLGASSAQEILLAGWSAGGAGLDELLLRGAADDGRVRRVASFDGYYNATERAADVKAGYRAFARRAARGEGELWVSTGQTGGPGHLSATESFAPLASTFGMRAVPPPTLPAGAPVPARSYARGLLRWLVYGPEVSHAEHATQVAPAVLSTMFGERHSSRGSGALLAALTLGAAAALYGGKTT